MAAPMQCTVFRNFQWISSRIGRKLHLTAFSSGDKIVPSTGAAVDDNYREQREAEIEKKRDVCRLPKRLQPFLHSRAKPRDPVYAFDLDIRRLRREYARLGAASRLDPSIMWPTVEELKKLEAWEDEWEPSLEQRFAIMKEKKQAEEDYINRRTTEVETRLADMPRLLKSYHAKQQKKQDLQQQQELKRQKLLDEAREYFGYEIDPRDPKFQEMVAQKEEEARQAVKREKKAKRIASKTASIVS